MIAAWEMWYNETAEFIPRSRSIGMSELWLKSVEMLNHGTTT